VHVIFVGKNHIFNGWHAQTLFGRGLVGMAFPAGMQESKYQPWVSPRVFCLAPKFIWGFHFSQIYSAGFISPKCIGGRFVVIGTILKIRRRCAGRNLQRGNPCPRKPLAGIHPIIN